MRQKGSILLPVILIFVLLSAVMYLVYKNAQLYRADKISTSLSSTPTAVPTTVIDSVPTVGLQKPSPTTFPTNNWKTYKNEKYGFSFKYDSSLNFQAEDIGKLSKEDNGINRTKYFVMLNNSQPPTVLFGLSPYYKQPTDGSYYEGVYLNYFSVWVMENNAKINPDKWYDKFVYFPLGFSKKQFDQYTKFSQEIDGVEGKYVDYMDEVEQKLILVRNGNYMYLIHINSSSDIDNQILSTFKFTE